MKKKCSQQWWGVFIASILSFHGIGSCLASTTLNGSGATFPAPLYIRWASEFQKNHPEIAVNYQGIGSGAGIVNFTKGLTDFCASDIAMTDADIEKNHGNIVMIPLTAGMIVLSYNLPNIKQLKLSREAYIGIFLGKITHWNDPLIELSNPGIILPSLPIVVVTRSDGSGTTALFTEHLAKISPEFNTEVGSGKSVKWPVGLAGKGNDGVTSLIKGTAGAIGYIEYGFAKNNNLPTAELQNKAGKIVPSSDKAGSLALANITLPDNLRSFVPDPEGPGDYPISGFTWVILKKSYPPEKNKGLKAFFSYALTEGQLLSSALGYLALPEAVQKKSIQALASIQESASK
ncbi:MAG: phosphate ABC transporter substrate-binding protein PstS [Chthoniobacterales bacterium]|nr:phosphate ABC transporter substrate-binding protein PstS [Chthoniobacterales bacterium]